MIINPSNFFNHYIINPLAPELSLPEKILAVVFAIMLLPVTLTIYCLRNRQITPANLAQNPTAAVTNRVAIPTLQPTVRTIPITSADIPAIVDEFINDFYATRLPIVEAVTVPVTDPATGVKTWRLWTSLTREEKISVNNTGTLPHNQLRLDTTEAGVNQRFFAGNGQVFYIHGDPRAHHGNDHCCRASIFAGVFARLYNKYHPAYEVTREDMILSQVIAAGHDSARQTEGPDVYDDRSAEVTQHRLGLRGITDPLILNDCHEAIAHKDSFPDGRKCLIAKCVQNADCAEFARLLLGGPRQDQGGFDNSRHYLDIYRELSALAREINPTNPAEAVLKNGLSFQDFCSELDTLRLEMNHFIYKTHQLQFRQQALQSESYYQTVLGAIHPVQHPLLHSLIAGTIQV